MEEGDLAWLGFKIVYDADAAQRNTCLLYTSLSYSKDAIGIGRKGTIDKPYLLRAPFWTVDTLFYAIPKAENDLDFIHSIFQKIEWRRRDESTGVPSLSKTAVTRIDVFSPSSAEQALILSLIHI